MLFIKLNIKTVVFFGFVIACSINVVSAMARKERARARTLSANFKISEPPPAVLFPLHEAAAKGEYKKLQKLCAQYADEKTLNDVINKEESIQSWFPAVTALQYALLALGGHINLHFQHGENVSQLENYAACNFNEESYQAFHGLAVEWLIIMKTLLMHGAILKVKTGQDKSKDLLKALLLAVEDEKAINKKEMGNILKQIYDGYYGQLKLIAGCMVWKS